MVDRSRTHACAACMRVGNSNEAYVQGRGGTRWAGNSGRAGSTVHCTCKRQDARISLLPDGMAVHRSEMAETAAFTKDFVIGRHQKCQLVLRRDLSSWRQSSQITRMADERWSMWLQSLVKAGLKHLSIPKSSLCFSILLPSALLPLFHCQV